MLFSNLVFLGFKCSIRAVCLLNTSQPQALLPFIPSLDQALEEEAVPATTRGGSGHRGSTAQMQSPLGWTPHGWAVAHHVHQSCASWAHLQWFGQLLYLPFLLWPQECLCCLSSLDLHVDPWQTQEVT